MSKREDLQKQLLELETKIQELLGKEDRTIDDVNALIELSGQVEEITKYIEAEERAEEAVAAIRKPTSQPADPGQPNTGQRQGFESFGEYLQAVARASSPVGGTIGGKPCGMIDRRLMPMREERSTGLEESTPALGGSKAA